MRIKKITQSTVTQAQILNNKSTSKKAGYSCDYINTLVQGLELFRGDTTGNPTLSESVSSFRRIKIYGYVVHNSEPSNRNCNFCQEFLVSENNNRYGLLALSHSGSTYSYIFGCTLTISGTTVTKGNANIYVSNQSADNNVTLHIVEIRGFYS